MSAEPLPATPAEALADVVAVLELHQLVGSARRDGLASFVGRTTRRSLPFVFGGQLVAQALSAAYETVAEPLRVHVLHCMFLAAGDPDAELHYAVETVRDGASFAVRQVTATQAVGEGAEAGGAERRTLFMALMSFTYDSTGPTHGREPGPEIDLDPARERPLDDWLRAHRSALPEWWNGPMPVDLRYVLEPPHFLSSGAEARDRQALWMRAAGRLPHDARVHDCLVAFASDLTLLDAVLLANAKSWYDGELRAASLDHSVWFHRRLRVDDWVLYEQTSPASYGGRGLATGDIFTAEGVLCVSVAQQGVIRLRN